MIAAQSYTVHEINSATGTVVRNTPLRREGIRRSLHGPCCPTCGNCWKLFEQYRAAVQSQSGAAWDAGPS